MISSIIDSIKGIVSVKVLIKGNRKLPWTKMKVTNSSAQAAIDDIMHQQPAFNLVKDKLRIKFGKKGSWCTYDNLPQHGPTHKQYITIISLPPREQRRSHSHRVQHHHGMHHGHHVTRNHRVQHHVQQQKPKIKLTISVNNKTRNIEIKYGTGLKKACRAIIKHIPELYIHVTEFKFTRPVRDMISREMFEKEVYGSNWKHFYHLSPHLTIHDDMIIKCRLMEDVPVETEHCDLCGALGGGGCPKDCHLN